MKRSGQRAGDNELRANMPALYLSLPFTMGTPFNFSAIRRASSPARYASNTGLSPLLTKQGPLALPLYPLVRIHGLNPISLASSANAIVAGVLPVPPSVKFPILITLCGSFFYLPTAYDLAWYPPPVRRGIPIF